MGPASRVSCVTNGSEAQLRQFAARIGAVVAVCACALLGGCSSVSHAVADNWPRVLGGLPEGIPPRNQNPPAYMSVNEPPPTRDTKKMTPEERAKAEAEMAASRSQNTSQREETKSQSSTRITPIQ